MFQSQPKSSDARAEERPSPRRSRLSEIARIAAAGLAIVFVGAILVLLLRDLDDDPAASGAGVTETSPTGEILVSWDPAGGDNYKLYVVDASGESIPRKLTPGPHEEDGVTERAGSWSPDGEQVTFVRKDGEQRDIVVVHWNGSNMLNLTQSPATDLDPAWSPDGSQIAWSSSHMDEGRVANIFVMNADGSDVRQLTNLGTGAFSPAWSPDGTQIAYGVRRMDFLQIWVMNADGSDARAITEIDDSFVLHESFRSRPQWSPDGQTIAFGTGEVIGTVSPDANEAQALWEGGLAATSNPDWSGTGQRLAYASEDPATGFRGIALTGPSGTRLENWSPPDVNYVDAPSWSPDSALLAFYAGSDRGETVWELHVAGSMGIDNRVLVHSGIDHTWPPDWRPELGNDLPPPQPTPPSEVVPTRTVPADPATPTPSTPDEPPAGWLGYEDQTQRGVMSESCGWPGGGPECVDSAGFKFPEGVMEIPQGVTLTFSIDGMTGNDLVNLWAQAFLLNEDAQVEVYQDTPTFMYEHPLPPDYELPLRWSPTTLDVTADLPPGEYAVAVRVNLVSDVEQPVNGQATTSGGSATYGFHIRVTGARTGTLPGIGVETQGQVPLSGYRSRRLRTIHAIMPGR